MDHRGSRGRRLVRVTAGFAIILSVLATDVGAALLPPNGDATPTVETAPVSHAGDAADDPAIWYNAADPARSAVIGNDKQGALEVYDLQGRRLQRITGGFFGNVDVRRGFATGAGRLDLVVVWAGGIRVFRIDRQTRKLSSVTDDSSGSIPVPTGGEGLCLYTSPRSGRTYVFVISRSGRVAQYELHDADRDGRVGARLRRQWNIGSEAEGCVADDELGAFYISEEAVGVWRYDAEPEASAARSARRLVGAAVSAGGHIRPDAEGLTLVYGAAGTGYLIVSSQAASDTDNSYIVYERQGANDYVRQFKVVRGASADGCGRTDGIDALATPLGPAFPHGIFICQDDRNTDPAPGNQNFKFVPLERVVDV